MLFEDPLSTNLGLNYLLGSFPGEPILKLNLNLCTKLFNVTIQMKPLWQNFCIVLLFYPFNPQDPHTNSPD